MDESMKSKKRNPAFFLWEDFCFWMFIIIIMMIIVMMIIRTFFWGGCVFFLG